MNCLILKGSQTRLTRDLVYKWVSSGACHHVVSYFTDVNQSDIPSTVCEFELTNRNHALLPRDLGMFMALLAE